MGDFAAETAVSQVDAGRYVGSVAPAWEIWGPNGGYLAALALRAAGHDSPFDRPASFSCHYLSPARFDQIQIEVRTPRHGRTSCSQLVEVHQEGTPILTASVWSISETSGLHHHAALMASVPGPDELPTFDRMVEGAADFRFWDNIESRRPPLRPDPLSGVEPAPLWRSWLRLRPTATFDDPWLDAARALVFLDIQCWPAALRLHGEGASGWVAPSLDLHASFHELATSDPWLLADGRCPVGTDGLLGWNGLLWSPGGHLVASGGGQALCRRLRRD